MAAVDPRQELAELEELERLERKTKLASAPTIGEKVSGAIENLKYLPGFMLDQGKNAARSLANTSEAALGAHPFIGPLVKGIKSLSGGNDGKTDFPIDPNETENQKRMRVTSEGVGSGLILPGGGAFATGATGAMSGLGGYFGNKFGETSGFPKLGEFLGAAIGGGLTGLATGPSQSAAKVSIRPVT